MCTQPVPVSIVTKSAVSTIDLRSRNGCWAMILSILLPGNDSSGSPVGSNFVARQNASTSRSARSSVSEIPSRCCPNRNACFARQFAAYDRKLDVNGGVVAFLIFHFGFSERRLRAGAPKDRLLRLINETFLNKHCESAQNFRFVFGIDRQIWMFPIAQDTESLELFALD